MTATTATLNQAVNAITVTVMSLHSANPTATGLVAEISGGGYARQAVTFGTATNGVRTLSNQPTFSVEAGDTVSHYAIWDGSTCKEFGAFAAPEVYGNAGTYKVTTGSIALTSA
jgi:hypothetical protein